MHVLVEKGCLNGRHGTSRRKIDRNDQMHEIVQHEPLGSGRVWRDSAPQTDKCHDHAYGANSPPMVGFELSVTETTKIARGTL